MTVDTLVAAPVTLPRVNLLPQEINAANAAQKVRFVLAGGLIVVVAGMGFLYISAGNTVSDAESRLADAQSQTKVLKGQVAAHAAITPLKNDVTSRRQLLSSAMAQNIPWALYMNDVQLALPPGSRLVTWTMSVSPPSVAAGTGFASNGTAVWTITGQAKSFDAVAKVIESIQQLSQVDSVIVTTATDTVDPDSGEKVVNFTLSARMNDKAIRPYVVKAGS